MGELNNWGFPVDPKEMTDHDVNRLLIVLQAEAHMDRVGVGNLPREYVVEALARAVGWGLNQAQHKIFLWNNVDCLMDNYTGTALAIAKNKEDAIQYLLTPENVPDWLDGSMSEVEAHLRQTEPDEIRDNLPCGFIFLGAWLRVVALTPEEKEQYHADCNDIRA
jgi:hypothetical protein